MKIILKENSSLFHYFRIWKFQWPHDNKIKHSGSPEQFGFNVEWGQKNARQRQCSKGALGHSQDWFDDFEEVFDRLERGNFGNQRQIGIHLRNWFQNGCALHKYHNHQNSINNSKRNVEVNNFTHCLKITLNVSFEFWHFPPFFVLLKLTCLVTLFDRKLQK